MSGSSLASYSLEGWLQEATRPLAGIGLPWLDAARRNARQRVRAQGVPNAKQEDWRYTGLKRLAEKSFAPCTDTLSAIEKSALEQVQVPGLDAYRAVLVNGHFMPHLSDLDGLPPSVRAGGLRTLLESDPDVLGQHLFRVAGEGSHIFSALNAAGSDDGFVLLLGHRARVDRPIELVHLSVGADKPRVAQPRHLVVARPGARVMLVERYVSIGEPLYCTNSLLELSLERDAVLEHHRVQTESRNAFHLTGLYLDQAQGSRYRGLNLGLGGAWSRTDLVVRFSGPDARCDLQGLYLAGDAQLVDYHLDMDHRVPHCTSNESFKGILHGRGRAIFDGRIHVAPGARKTDAQLSNRNLLLSRSAEVDTKPQLEIFADDVKCSHGTTVGQIDPEALFYLRSRGISEPAARRMLCLGFVGEIIDAVEPQSLREYVAEQVGQRLEPNRAL
jgi:Fe-S cluster assembly protein SufD